LVIFSSYFSTYLGGKYNQTKTFKMKNRITFLVVALLLGSQAQMVLGQSTLPETLPKNYNTEEYYSLVEKGAFWGSRPEAKDVYEGKIPSGVSQILNATEPFLVRYSEGEHTVKDKNFIIAPTGSRFYEVSDGWHDSYCGNRLSYCQPLSKMIVQKIVDTVYIEKNTVTNTVVHDTVWQYKFAEDQQYEESSNGEQITIVNVIDGGQPTYHQEYCPIVPMLICMAFAPPPPMYYGGGYYSGGVSNNNTYIDNSYYNVSTTTNNTTINHR